MSVRSTSPPRGYRRVRSDGARRRRAGLLVALAALVGVVVWVTMPTFNHAVNELALPLRHEDIIRQQAREKGLDPALVAGVIFVESRFREQTSPTGATGLMQIEPDTARFLARRSGGTAFQVSDLGTPQVNIAYGSYYLRYLLDRYHGNTTLALAAYNGGAGNVSRWLARARAGGHRFRRADIGFAETRDYVAQVLHARVEYRANYARELGLG